jgi:hypothetical protein
MRIYKEQYELWNKLPANQKYATYNSALVSIRPKKFWFYALYNDDKIFIEKNMLKIKLILYENYNIYTNDKYLYLPRQLSNEYCEKYFTKNGDNVRNKFFEIDRKIPLLYLIEVDKCKEIKVRKNNSYMWYVTSEINVIVKSIEYKEVVDEYRYGVVKAEMV